MENWLTEATKASIVLIDGMALLIVLAGTVEAVVSGMRVFLRPDNGHERRAVWLRYARWLVAALTFQLAADILETSITTDWDSLARVGAIAAIRTFLNYFLDRDVEEIRSREREAQGANVTDHQPRSKVGA